MKHIQQKFTFRPLGDSALVIQLSNKVNSTIHSKVITLVELLEAEPFDGFIEAMPGYNNVTVFYDPFIVHLKNQDNSHKTSFKKVSVYMERYMDLLEEKEISAHKLVKIPVLYGGKSGPDLDLVAKHNGISQQDVIDLHTNKDYLVYMIGFAPGFPYLGEVDQRIATPRKSKPRPKISAGSVGIAGEQTGMYSLDSPGGWQVIGKTPVNLFIPNEESPTLLKSGDKIRFIPITEDEYLAYETDKEILKLNE